MAEVRNSNRGQESSMFEGFPGSPSNTNKGLSTGNDPAFGQMLKATGALQPIVAPTVGLAGTLTGSPRLATPSVNRSTTTGNPYGTDGSASGATSRYITDRLDTNNSILGGTPSTTGLGNNLDYNTWADAYGGSATPEKYGEYLSGKSGGQGMTGAQIGGLALGGINTLLAYKQYGLAKDQFEFNKQSARANYAANAVQANNSINSSNNLNQGVTNKANSLSLASGGLGNQVYQNKANIAKTL